MRNRSAITRDLHSAKYKQRIVKSRKLYKRKAKHKSKDA